MKGAWVCGSIYLVYRERQTDKQTQKTTKKMEIHGSSGYYLKLIGALDKRRLG